MAYIGDTLETMTAKNLSTDQKLDLLIKESSEIKSTVKRIDSNVRELILSTAELTLLAGQTADRVTKVEKSSRKSFTPFTSGAFVA